MSAKTKTLLFLLVLFGAMNTLLLKLMNIQSIRGVHFYHPFIQTLLMFIAECFVIVPYLLNCFYTPPSLLPTCPNYMILLPAVMDLLASLLSYTALNMTPGSVWQISRGGNIIAVAILSRIFLKQIFAKISILGCVIAFLGIIHLSFRYYSLYHLGITSVQVVNLFVSSTNQNLDTTTEIIGIVLLVISIIFNGIGLILEKNIFNRFQISPLKMVALQGIYGTIGTQNLTEVTKIRLIGMFSITFASQYIQCIWANKSLCVDTGNGNYYFESFRVYFQQLKQSWLLVVLNVGFLLTVAISVPIAVTISKVINPMSRALADICRTLIIWGVGIVLTLTVKGDYVLQSTNLLANGLKCIGFVLVIVGTLMYHQFICKSKIPQNCLSLKAQQINNVLTTKNIMDVQ